MNDGTIQLKHTSRTTEMDAQFILRCFTTAKKQPQTVLYPVSKRLVIRMRISILHKRYFLTEYCSTVVLHHIQFRSAFTLLYICDFQSTFVAILRAVLHRLQFQNAVTSLCDLKSM